MTPEEKRKPDYWNLKEALRYFFRKKDPQRPSNTNIRIMHGINRIAIIVFLLGIIYLIIKYAIQ